MDRMPLITLSLFSGLMLGISWPYTGGMVPLVFVALIPVFMMEEIVYKRRYRPVNVFLQAYAFFFVFNSWTTWWIYYASGGGMAMAVVFNSFLMAIPFWLFHLAKRRIGKKEGYVAFFAYWLTFEYLHYSWELSFPWLTLGNVFADSVKIVQWFDITGTAGGTLWILWINLLFFFIIRDVWMYERRSMYSQTGRIVFILILIGVPIFFSLKTYHSYEEKSNPAEVVIVQPNIDPYHVKFTGSISKQLEIFTELADLKMDSTVDFLVGPETQLPSPIMENEIEMESEIKYLRSYLDKFPRARLITGMSSYSLFPREGNTSPSAKPTDDPDVLYDYYNSAIQIKSGEPIEIYHKIKLVLGVEKIPFAKWLPFLERLALDMGGASGTLGVEKGPEVFRSHINPQFNVAPAICYESIYGEHLAQFVQNGANLIFIITNDGWWDNTPGHRQHMAYARLRAIENRRSIARCANTGISCFINQRGDILERTQWWEPAVIRSTINANSDLTYYTTQGDYIGRTASFLSILLIIYTFANMIRGKSSYRGEV